MAGKRRNQITRGDTVVVAVVAVVAGVAAAFSGNEPTGDPLAGALLTAGLAAFVTWAAAGAPWWALLGGAGITFSAGLWGPALPLLLSLGAIGLAAWIGSRRQNQPVARAVAGALVVQSSLRLDDSPFFLATALVAAAAIGLVAIAGVVRRRKYIRRRVYIGAGIVGALAVVASGLFGIAAAQARAPLTAGYQGLRDGLEFVEQGDTERASAVLYQAAADLDIAGDRLGGPLAAGAGFVPGIAQNRSAATELIDGAVEGAEAAARALRSVDLDRLQIVNGRIDVEALEELAVPLADLSLAVSELTSTIRESASDPWLVSPLQSRLTDALTDAVRVERQAVATAETARLGPALLGADGPRRYLLAFVNPAETRGQTGLMGNWNELTIDRGQLSITASGRTAQLQRALRERGSAALVDLDEFVANYGYLGAGAAVGEPVEPRFWANVTASPHGPDVGAAMAQMYGWATGAEPDGVFVIDPAAIAGLVRLTGPITIEGLDEPLTADNVEQFLVRGQYEFEEADRELVLEEVTRATVERVLTTSLPGPRELIEALAPPAMGGSLTGWATRAEEQALFRLVGFDGSIPSSPGRDGLAIGAVNTAGNKIDSFLEREIVYRPSYDPATGRVDATLEITLTNTAPTSGFPDYVIGSLADGLPRGFNRGSLSIHTPLEVESVTLDGTPLLNADRTEGGWNVVNAIYGIPSGGSSVIRVEMAGVIAVGDYRFHYKPYPLPIDDHVVVEGRVGDTEFRADSNVTSFDRRTVVRPSGVSAYYYDGT
jgi:hypothetical protein